MGWILPLVAARSAFSPKDFIVFKTYMPKSDAETLKLRVADGW